MTQEPSDLTLARQVSSHNDRHAFDQLVRRHQSAVRRFLLHLTLGNEPLSDDLAQETFLKAYLHISQFRATATFQTWLLRIAYREFYNDRRTHRQVLTQHYPEEETGTTSIELKSDICQALSLLKEEERICITLQLIEGEPIAHIAEITSMQENTVKSHLKRGKERLVQYLKQNGYD